MSPGFAFVALFALTLCLLIAVALSGLYSRRKLHLVLVACTAISLAATIWAAKRLGKVYDLEAAGAITPIHLFLAKLATAAYVLPVTSGLLLLSGKRVRSWHRRAAFLALGLTLIAAVTGVWMILCSVRLG